MLKLKGMSESEIDNVVDKIKESREQIKKYVIKYLAKINASYGMLDIPEIIKKGLKHADKHGLTDAQKKVFIDHVLKGDTYHQYSYQDDLKYSVMSKFLGFDAPQGQMIRINPKDHSKLNELHLLYDETKHIHADVKNQIYNYRDCAPEAVTGSYDRTKHNASIHVHPIIAALFLPKVDYLERRMLYTNIPRMVLSRGQAYLKNYNFHLQTNVAPGELDAEFELAHSIANDPNALEYFKDDSPLDNILKRARCQIALYKAVLNLRQGKYYSTGYNENDGISEFLKVIGSYDWTFFDSPEMFHIQDEGTVLRKLLAVFSVRPTFTQLSSFSNRYGLGYTTINSLAKTVFVNIPIVNIKLPIDLSGTTRHTISLSRALSQTDYFIEHRVVVPKNKSVIYSNQVAFFYANRRYPTINFNTLNMSMRYSSLPVSFVNQTTINNTVVTFEPRTRIGREYFDLRSVVVLKRPPLSGINVATGCAALIAADRSSAAYIDGTMYLMYNPADAPIQIYDPETSTYVSNSPITIIPEVTATPNDIGFRNEAQERGVVFFYTRDRASLRV